MHEDRADRGDNRRHTRTHPSFLYGYDFYIAFIEITANVGRTWRDSSRCAERTTAADRDPLPGERAKQAPSRSPDRAIIIARTAQPTDPVDLTRTREAAARVHRRFIARVRHGSPSRRRRPGGDTIITTLLPVYNV
jgi:hypothetical protein